MGMKKACDVYGTVKDVRAYRIQVTEMANDGERKIDERKADLCPRGLVRLLSKIRSGTTDASRPTKDSG